MSDQSRKATDGGECASETQQDCEDGVSIAAAAKLPTEGDADDYVIVLNGDPMEWLDAGGYDPDGYVMGHADLGGERVEVTVSYGMGGVSGCSLHFRERDESHSLTEQSDDDDQSLEFYADDVPGVSACVELLPESEVMSDD